MGTIAILQARMSSSRLPGKVLADVAGAPMIQRQIERVLKAEQIDELIVATSIETSDDPLADFLAGIGQKCFRGSLENVLDRFNQVLELNKFETCVRLTGDCPLSDPEVIDMVISRFKNSDADYCSNTLGRTFPRGLDVEVFKSSVINSLANESVDPLGIEHVTYGIYTNPERFKIIGVEQNPSYAHFRWTVDTKEDLEFVRMIFKEFQIMGIDLNQTNLIHWLLSNPEKIHLESADH